MATDQLFKLKATPLDIEAQAEKLYGMYPRKKSKGSALTSIRRALRKATFDVLADAVAEYSRACKATQKDEQYIPYPATWFNGECWKDNRDDWWRGADTKEAEAVYGRMLAYVHKHGRHGPAPKTDAHLFVRAKRVIRSCPGGWTAFCDGKISESTFIEQWRLLK